MNVMAKIRLNELWAWLAHRLAGKWMELAWMRKRLRIILMNRTRLPRMLQREVWIGSWISLVDHLALLKRNLMSHSRLHGRLEHGLADWRLAVVERRDRRVAHEASFIRLPSAPDILIVELPVHVEVSVSIIFSAVEVSPVFSFQVKLSKISFSEAINIPLSIGPFSGFSVCSFVLRLAVHGLLSISVEV